MSEQDGRPPLTLWDLDAYRYGDSTSAAPSLVPYADDGIYVSAWGLRRALERGYSPQEILAVLGETLDGGENGR